MTPSNPLHYPRWIRLTPESEPIIVQNHYHHSTMVGQEYDENAQLVVTAPVPEPVPVASLTSVFRIFDASLGQPVQQDPFLNPEEKEAAIEAAAGLVAGQIPVEEPHVPTEEEAEDLGRLVELEEAGAFTPVDDDELAGMFAKPAEEVSDMAETDKPKRGRKAKE